MNVVVTMIAPVALRVIRGCAKSVSIQEIRQNKTTRSVVITAIVHVDSLVIPGCAKSASIPENPQQGALADPLKYVQILALIIYRAYYLETGT